MMADRPVPPPARLPNVFNTYHGFIRYAVDDNALSIIRDHQRKAVVQTATFFRENNLGQLVLPTGSDKSGIAVLLPYYMGVSKVFALSPSPELAQEFAFSFCGPNVGVPDRGNDAFLFKIGIIPAYDNPERQTILAERASLLPRYAYATTLNEARNLMGNELLVINRDKIQLTTKLRIEEFPLNYDLVIVDEAHHFPAPTWRRIIDHYSQNPGIKILFMTATPNDDTRIAEIWRFSLGIYVPDEIPAIQDSGSPKPKSQKKPKPTSENVMPFS